MSGFKIHEKRFLNFKGIRFKTWVYSFLLTTIILVILLFMQIGFSARYYQNLKLTDVERVGANLCEAYKTRPNNRDFKNLASQTQLTSDVSIKLFKVKYQIIDGKAEVDEETFFEFLTSPIYGGGTDDGFIQDENFIIDASFFTRLEQDSEVTYTSMTSAGALAVYGARINDRNDGDVFLYVSSKLYLSEFTVSALRRQAVLSTIICAAISLLLSGVVSSAIARPITQFSKTARRLASGDYSVRFNGGGLSEVNDLAQTLNYATEEMGKTETLRRDLLANVSHDLRTPLTMVKAYAEMIRDLSGADPKKRISHSQTIIDEADRLTSLVNDIQNLSKLQSGTSKPEFTSFDISALTKRVVDKFALYSSTDGYLFKSQIKDGLMINADEAKIEQVLYNLIGNAVNYTGKDKMVTIYLKEHNAKVFFGVKDSGKGIAQNEIDAVWERYYRSKATKRTRIGTGLGLSIVKNILLLHSAEFGIISKVGEGSTFWFSLPLFDPAAPLPEPEIKTKARMLK